MRKLFSKTVPRMLVLLKDLMEMKCISLFSVSTERKKTRILKEPDSDEVDRVIDNILGKWSELNGKEKVKGNVCNVICEMNKLHSMKVGTI